MSREFFDFTRSEHVVQHEGREFFVLIDEHQDMAFVFRISQRVAHPRAFCVVKRRVFPSHPLKKSAAAVLRQIGADERGHMSLDALARVGGAA